MGTILRRNPPAPTAGGRGRVDQFQTGEWISFRAALFINTPACPVNRDLLEPAEQAALFCDRTPVAATAVVLCSTGKAVRPTGKALRPCQPLVRQTEWLERRTSSRVRPLELTVAPTRVLVRPTEVLVRATENVLWPWRLFVGPTEWIERRTSRLVGPSKHLVGRGRPSCEGTSCRVGRLDLLVGGRQSSHGRTSCLVGCSDCLVGRRQSFHLRTTCFVGRSPPRLRKSYRREGAVERVHAAWQLAVAPSGDPVRADRRRMERTEAEEHPKGTRNSLNVSLTRLKLRAPLEVGRSM